MRKHAEHELAGDDARNQHEDHQHESAAIRGAKPWLVATLTAQRLVPGNPAGWAWSAPQAIPRAAEEAPFDRLRNHATPGQRRARPQTAIAQRERGRRRRPALSDQALEAPGDKVVESALPQYRVEPVALQHQVAQRTQRLRHGVTARFPLLGGDGAFHRLLRQRLALRGGNAERFGIGDGAGVCLTPILHQALGRHLDGRRAVRVVSQHDARRGGGGSLSHGWMTPDQVSVSELPPWSRKARSSTGLLPDGLTWNV